eukprot:TRINITY_DN62997_c0_g1_i1.p1 TRINITY_DN62997_c0_g1~~TRINITY_DN62997_c0_g1_i1.p1  ORF type:complete len:516 (+),score=110.56 TRINITY_DN62997_c0_g1_i1:61-1608(+)
MGVCEELVAEEESDAMPCYEAMCDDTQTLPPMRLRMVSGDVLCIRSMEVEWEEGGRHHSWSSWEDDMENGWYEAEKLLPSIAREVSVRFKVRGLGGPWDVCKVDRREGRRWVMDGKEHALEVITFAKGHRTSEAVDAVFELRGPMNGCYVHKAWNAANDGECRASWEYWKDDGSRPQKEPRAATLEAADGAAPGPSCSLDAQVSLLCSMKRMCAAAQELLNVHRRTLEGLRSLDASITGQWVSANVGTTTSAGLGIASAVLLFVAPPVGLGIGIGSALTGGITFAGDSVADRAHHSELKRQLSVDAREAFVVAELLRQWVSCQDSLGAAVAGSKLTVVDKKVDSEKRDSMDLGDAVDAGLYAGAAAQATGSQATSLARTVANLGATATVAVQVLGVAGALISTGFAVRGWSQTKSNQLTVRSKIGELLLRVLQLQHLLAAVDRLECPVCLENVTLADEVRHCSDSHHCFHASCLQQRRDALGIEGQDFCPVCAGPLDAKEETKVESVDRFRVLQN